MRHADLDQRTRELAIAIRKRESRHAADAYTHDDNDFVRSDGHMVIVKRRREWFERPDKPYQVFWWVAAGHQPGIDEAAERLDRLREHGSTQYAFSPRDAVAVPS